LPKQKSKWEEVKFYLDKESIGNLDESNNGDDNEEYSFETMVLRSFLKQEEQKYKSGYAEKARYRDTDLSISSTGSKSK
jgi:hypothetical protein